MSFKTVVYARPAGVEVALDYALPPSASPQSPAPILLWFHGGGLLQGTRKRMPPHIANATAHGLAVVSADYRLAPQTRLPGIMADIAACMHYLRSPEFANETGNRVNQRKIVVSCGSAGGWLALLLATGIGFAECGLSPPPHPAACCAIYPITDITDRFWTTPQRPVSYIGAEVDRTPLLPYLDPAAPPTSFSLPTDARSQMYGYMLQEGIEQQLLLEGEGISPASFRIAAGVGSGKFALPPTYIVHGTLDDKVPPRQSEDVAHAAEHVGAPVELDLVEGADHLFDFEEGVEMDAMYRFIKSVL